MAKEKAMFSAIKFRTMLALRETFDSMPCFAAQQQSIGKPQHVWPEQSALFQQRLLHND